MARRPPERRSHPRIEARVPLRIIWDARPDGTATQTCNLSRSGLYGTVPVYIPPFSRLSIVMSLPFRSEGNGGDRPVQFEGVVVRSEPDKQELKREGYGIAIYFSDISDEARALIDSYISEQMKKPTVH
jgi:hypothetical protein